MEYQYVYLIREREFIQLNKPIYKIGKTKQSNFTRFSQYPKDSAMIFQSACSDCDICEKEIIKCFKIKYLQKKEIGNEKRRRHQIYFKEWKKEKFENLGYRLGFFMLNHILVSKPWKDVSGNELTVL